jgi:hypothetical protein
MRTWVKSGSERDYEVPSGLMMKLLKPPLRCAMPPMASSTLSGEDTWCS